MDTKVLVIGIDGMDPSLVEKWMDNLPNLQKLAGDGSWGILESSVPTMTIPAWQWLSTGKQSGKIGVYGHLKRREGTYIFDVVSRSDIKSLNIWTMLDRHGTKCGVINYPLTYPPDVLQHGFMVSGVPSPPNQMNLVFTHPPGLSRELDSLYKGARYGLDDFIRAQGLQSLIEVMRNRTKAIEYLMENRTWDCLIAVYRGLDKASHVFWYEQDKLMKYYVQQDKEIGKILEKAPRETDVFIVSDHGFCGGEGDFFVNEWLRKKGYLRVEKEKLTHHVLRKLGVTRERGIQLLDRLELRALLMKLIPSQLLHLIPSPLSELRHFDVNWSKTQAYVFGTTGTGNIRINLEGREPQGAVVPGKEYMHLRKELIEELKKLSFPKKNKALVESVWDPDELYHGEYVKDAPDIIFRTSNNKYIANMSLGHDAMFRHRRLGVHRSHGIIMMKGKHMNQGKKINASLLDVVPTILYIFDLPLPTDLDGKIIWEAMAEKGDVKYQKPRKYKGTEYAWSDKDRQQILERLKDMGYLD